MNLYKINVKYKAVNLHSKIYISFVHNFFRIIRGGEIPTYSINRRGKVQPYKYSPVSQGCYKNFGGERKNGREGRVHQSDYKKL